MHIKELEERFEINESRQKREILLYENEINNFKIQKSIRVNAILFSIATILAGFIIFITKIFFDRKKANSELIKRYTIIESQRQLLIEQKNKLNTVNEELSKQISKAQKQKLEIEKTNIELEATLKELESQNLQITDSILFAQNIQKSIMASEIDLRGVFSDFTLFSQSKNLVSGDFIWCQEYNGFYYYAVADATGHGVPGAVVSVMCMVLLNQIISEDHNNSPKIIMEKLHSKLCNIFSVNDATVSSELKVMESIDIAICRFDKDFNSLSFCSAKRPMIICFENNSIELLGDKFSVGSFLKKNNIAFTEQNLLLTKPFNAYLFTDGLQDQMNDKSQKIGYAKIKDFLMMNGYDSIHMATQLIKEMFFRHKHNDIQTDDVTFTALRVN
ncbi:MAG: SpoIIE family protein phosphatase [Bacteroidetes bacterium]|nr:SpoIIE family protein phosphatase [Bacteroidota bacterium]